MAKHNKAPVTYFQLNDLEIEDNYKPEEVVVARLFWWCLSSSVRLLWRFQRRMVVVVIR